MFHGLTLYGCLWSKGSRPRPNLRKMTGDLPDREVLSDDVPNPKSHTFSFMMKLLAAWVAMGFWVPRITIGREELETGLPSE